VKDSKIYAVASKALKTSLAVIVILGYIAIAEGLGRFLVLTGAFLLLLYALMAAPFLFLLYYYLFERPKQKKGEQG
jgi:uncharacterized RDD family membrane protein YckC